MDDLWLQGQEQISPALPDSTGSWSEERRLALVSHAKRLLAEAKTVQEVKGVRDQAEAMRVYLKQRDEGLEAQNMAAEIKLWSERRAGALLKEGLPRQTLGRPEKTSNDSTFSLPKLADLGISRDESSRWQCLANLSEADLEQHIEETKAAGKELTTAAALRYAKRSNVTDIETDLKALTLHEAIDRLDTLIKSLFIKWPESYRDAMGHHLINLGQEILEHGDLRST
jgi:hypothetical protein